MALVKTTLSSSNGLPPEAAEAVLALKGDATSIFQNPKLILKMKFGEQPKDLALLLDPPRPLKEAKENGRQGRKNDYLKAAREIGEKLALNQKPVETPEIRMAYVPNLIIQSDQTLMARVA